MKNLLTDSKQMIKNFLNNLLQKKKLEKLKKIYKNYILEKKFFLPRIVHLETRTKCSGRCSFCLAAVATDPRNDELMSMDLFLKIINDLKTINYNNRLSLYNNNEPLLDSRIFELVKISRRELPKSFIEIKTNGRSLTFDKLVELFNSGLDYLYINDYVDEESYKKKFFSKRVEELQKEIINSRRFKGKNEDHSIERISIALRFEGEVLNSRAGTAPNRKDVLSNSCQWKPKQLLCFRPFEMITINPNGYVALCSEDLLFKEVIGDVKKDTIKDIWMSDKYFLVRDNLLQGNRDCKSTCSKCDYRGFTMESFLDHKVV
jgi:radical SAM protein with 4Fe4S-binding SPASM domain